ncbi:palmitoyltransferase PFA3 [Rhodotorula toruloides]|uniref:Palmitoyltransferase n=1 Tax=Rhodotorula toruloides TaxID=5286 RepID=A0A511KL97_RHOTO|nr:palmitoyltransferase PFA3 [Rhodotorula toruloides]
MIPVRRPLPAHPLLSFPPDSQLAKPAALPRREDERPRSTALKVLLFAPLVFVFCLLGFAAYAFLWSLCIGYLVFRRHATLRAILYSAPFTWFLFACGGSFWMAYWRGGGVVPGAAEWKRGDDEARVASVGVKRELRGFFAEREEDAGEDEGLLEAEEGARGRRRTLQVKSDGSVRFCRKCNIPKPDRAHHCSSCGRCVLKMDHHCPWLGGGCVGWANYKFFLLALWYTGILGIYSSVVLFHELVAFVGEHDDGFELAPISWALAALLGVIFGVAVGCFGLYHLYLACKNRTTIEAMEHPTSLALLTPSPSHPSSHRTLTPTQRRRLAGAARTYNIYDLGTRENLRQVFGGRERWCEWGCPWGWPPGDGQTFPINEDHLDQLRRITEQVYADAATGSAYEVGGPDSDEESPSDEDGPIRRA